MTQGGPGPSTDPRHRSLDTNNAGARISLDWGCTTNTGNPQVGTYTCTCTWLQSVPTQDCSPRPLFTAVDPSVGSLATFSAMAALFDNYLASPGEVEQHTEQEVQEERLFLQEAMATDVMKTTLQFLVDRGQ